MKLIIKNKRNNVGMSRLNPIEGYSITFVHFTDTGHLMIEDKSQGVFRGDNQNMKKIDEAIVGLNEIKRFLIENPDFTEGNVELVEEIKDEN